MEDVLKKSREIAKMLGAKIGKNTIDMYEIHFEDPKFKFLSGMTILKKTNEFLTNGDIQLKVIEHIEELGFIVIIAGKECSIESNDEQYSENNAWYEKIPSTQIEASGETKKEAIFQAIYEFSLMYNNLT